MYTTGRPGASRASEAPICIGKSPEPENDVVDKEQHYRCNRKDGKRDLIQKFQSAAWRTVVLVISTHKEAGYHTDYVLVFLGDEFQLAKPGIPASCGVGHFVLLS